MKLTLSWLKDHLDTQADLKTVVDTLTRIGLEVENVDDPSARLGAFTVAKVLSAERHPQADKLQVLSVDTGAGEPVQVVCGAPNARAGLVGVFGAPGTYVPGSGITLKVASIRGVESRGMMCSMRELELSDEHDGIIDLPADAPLGARFADYAGLGDPVIDISVTPNRQDCMGVRGIARDLAAAGLGELKPLIVLAVKATFPSPIAIRIEDADGCPVFHGRVVRKVANGAAPEWMRRRLAAVGQRTISALVDVTNYVMLDLGRPLHVYDMAKVQGAIVARRGRDGETIAALNGKAYPVTSDMTVIADDAQALGIGGVIGGDSSGVSESTTDVLIECAWFTPERIAQTGQALALSTDARQRFERGVDPASLDDGLAIATRLIKEACGGEASDVVRAGEAPDEVTIIDYDTHAVERLGGITVPPDRQRIILRSLGFGVDGAWNVRVPSWRRDVEGVADLVEEVVRIEGIDRVPPVPLPRPDGVARPTATPAQKVERRIRRTAAARGAAEAVTWSFLPEVQAAIFGGSAWTLANPISEELKAMRPSLLPGLLAAAARNVARGAGTVRLFEIGRRYLADGERATLGLVLLGAAGMRDWRSGKPAGFDMFDAKAEAIALLAAGGAPTDRLQVMEPASEVWHPGRSGTLRLGPKNVLAAFGELHPATLAAFDLSGPAAAVELYLDAIPAPRGGGHLRDAYRPPVLQPVTRDFAFLAPTGLAADALIRAVRGADKSAILGARVFDLFTGAGVPEGHGSIAIEVTLQPAEKSFTEADLTAISARVVAAAAKLGATLRG